MRDLHRRLEEQGQERLLFAAPTRNAKRLIEIAAAVLGDDADERVLSLIHI